MTGLKEENAAHTEKKCVAKRRSCAQARRQERGTPDIKSSLSVMEGNGQLKKKRDGERKSRMNKQDWTERRCGWCSIHIRSATQSRGKEHKREDMGQTNKQTDRAR